MLRLVLTILWPSFLVAGLAVGCLFSLFEPELLAPWPPIATYTIGFFSLWTMTSLASMLTCYLLTVPEDHNPPI